MSKPFAPDKRYNPWTISRSVAVFHLPQKGASESVRQTASSARMLESFGGVICDCSLNGTGMTDHRKSFGRKDINESARYFWRAVFLGLASFLLLLAGTLSIGPQPRVISRISPDEFVQAIVTHRTSLIDLYLDEHLAPNRRAAHDRPLLVAAAMEQDWDTMKRLLQAGARPDLADENGTTALMLAAKHGNVNILHRLTGTAMNIEFADRNGWTALHHAVGARQTKAIEFLLPLMPHLARYGSDLLALAIATGDMRIAEYLSEQMPPLDKWSPGARQVLDQTIAGSNHAAVRLLLNKHAEPPTMGNSNVPLLAYAIAKEDTKLFEELLACGADPNTTLPNRPSQDFLSQLKSRRLRYYLEGEKGVTVLMLAAGTGNTEFVRALLDAGGNRSSGP